MQTAVKGFENFGRNCLSRTYSCMHAYIYMHAYVYTRLQMPTVAHCLLNQVQLDPLTIIVSLLVTRVSASRACDMYFSRYTKLERQTRRSFHHRESMVYFSLANTKAGKITFQHNLLDARYKSRRSEFSVVIPESIET